jgi:hypothetical protein
MRVPHVDVNALIQSAGADWRTSLMHEDGLHMSPAGNALIFDAVMAAVRDHFPHLAPAALPLHFPAFDRINVAHPAETFGALYGRLQGGLVAAASGGGGALGGAINSVVAAAAGGSASSSSGSGSRSSSSGSGSGSAENSSSGSGGTASALTAALSGLGLGAAGNN